MTESSPQSLEQPAEPAAAAEASPSADRATLDISITASANFAAILAQHRISLLVSTYDAGKLIILRASGQSLNVHFVGFDHAMGIAATARQIAVGTKFRIAELFNMPALCSKVPHAASEPIAHDACYVPRSNHVTGMIDIHEMAYGGAQLWYINTRFSCLCTRDSAYSFVPQWRPPFVKGLSADDRCHLNGLAMVGDRPAYVSAIAATDDPEGWRPHRTTGGIVMEVPSGEIVARGLSMPHSPRVYANELWVLESGTGSLCRVDRRNGNFQTAGVFSGFTRGLDFRGNLAFVGLSKVRGLKAVFGGLALTDRIPEHERFCGIQVLNLASGRTEAFLKFDSGVTEVFAVVALDMRFPAILEEDDPLIPDAFALPAEALAQVR